MARISKTDIINKLALHEVFADQPKTKIKAFVEDFFADIVNEVTSGNEVAIAGFGKFYKFEKTKDGKKTGEFTPKFKAAKAFKDTITA